MRQVSGIGILILVRKMEYPIANILGHPHTCIYKLCNEGRYLIRQAVIFGF